MDHEIGSSNQVIEYTKRACHFCHKEFSSGKALGGHMRIHIHKKKVDDDDHHHNCVICGKAFPSPKSLHGHMKSHPERGWKGVNPPSFHSSSSLLTSSSTDYPKSRTLDLLASLKGWQVTAERGRRATASSEEAVSSSPVDVELMDAVNYLLMLKEMKNPCDSEIRGGNESRLCDGEFECGANKNKGRRLKKKMKLSELEMYKCDVCDKYFSSFQALRGHRSSRNKVKTLVGDSSSGESKAALSSRVAGSLTRPRGLRFDLNEAPPVSGVDLR